MYRAFALLSCLVIVGCGGGGGSSDTGTATIVETIKLAGSVGDGPVVGATITAKDANGKVITSTTSNNSAAYEITVPSDTSFPVTITAIGGTDIVSGMAPDFTLVTVAMNKADLTSSTNTVNINPFSTFIVYMAQSMNGGLNTQNITSAKLALFDTFSFGLDASSIADPISTDIDDINIAGMVKASESMGEMIRRTRDAMISSGNNIDGDYVLTKLANDLADGKLDAIGSNTVSAVSATAKIVSAQVLLETILNRLKVNGALATSLLDSAILTSQPNSVMSTADVPLTSNVLAQTQTALAAVERFAPSTAVSNLASTVAGLSNNVTVADVNTVLAINSESILDAAINLAPLATSEELASINDDDANSTNATPIAPVIFSNPTLTAHEGVAYNYDVNASDANNGDSLTYTLTSAPAGMTINAINGIISWMPTASQVGSQSINVRVTDNGSPALSANQSFSINVTADKSTVIRINAGGGEYVDSKGQTWAADYGYNLGAQSTVTDTINGTVDDILYQSERWHSGWEDTETPELEYRFTLPSGNYAVKLHFAEINKYVNRNFDVEIEGKLTIDNLDIISEAGRYTAVIKNIVTTVNDGELNIRFPRNTQSPKISAIEILQAKNLSNATTTNTNPTTILVPEANLGAGTLSIIGEPSNGNTVVSGYSITYTPNGGFDGQDSIIYMFTDANGSVTISTIDITVTCNSCNKEAIIALSWQPNTEAISGYRIYYGPDAANVTELATDVTVNSGLIDPTAPQLKYAATSDLNFYPGEQLCFKIQAYKDNQNSALSGAICGTI